MRAGLVRRRQTLAWAFVLIAAASAVGGARPVDGRDAMQTVTIRVVVRYSALPVAAWQGTFVSTSSSGRVVDRGTVIDRPRQKLGANWAIWRTLRGKFGKLRFRIVGPYRTPVAKLTWTILSGTGAYAGLNGTGADIERVARSKADAQMSGVPMR
jgi:hypothetical protein